MEPSRIEVRGHADVTEAIVFWVEYRDQGESLRERLAWLKACAYHEAMEHARSLARAPSRILCTPPRIKALIARIEPLTSAPARRVHEARCHRRRAPEPWAIGGAR